MPVPTHRHRETFSHLIGSYGYIFIWKDSQPFIYRCAPRGTRTGQCPAEKPRLARSLRKMGRTLTCPLSQGVHHNGQCTLLVICKVSFELPFVECDIVSFQDKTEVHCACHILLKLGFYEFHLRGTDFD